MALRDLSHALLCSIALSVACTSDRQSAPAAASAPLNTGEHSANSQTSNHAPAATASEPPSTPSTPSRASTPVTVAFTRELGIAASHLALDKPPHAAALSAGAVHVHDAKGWREEPLPKPVRESRDLELRIFYGRDYRVRVVGTRAGAKGTEGVYLRALPGGLRPAPEEIGSLGNTRAGALIALLGTADPELVCRPSELCLVKRLSGWKRLPAPSEIHELTIADGVGYVLSGRTVRRAEEGWPPVGPDGSWQQASALFAVSGSVFVLEKGRAAIHELAPSATEWILHDSIVGAPISLWGAERNALWLVGERGVAHFDGVSWRPVAEAPPGLQFVLGRAHDDVWFAGASGVYRAGHI